MKYRKRSNTKYMIMYKITVKSSLNSQCTANILTSRHVTYECYSYLFIYTQQNRNQLEQKNH